MEHANVAIARQWHTKHVSMAVDMNAITEELLEAVFAPWSMSMSNH
jgi:hypothetical protein